MAAPPWEEFPQKNQKKWVEESQPQVSDSASPMGLRISDTLAGVLVLQAGATLEGPALCPGPSALHPGTSGVQSDQMQGGDC